MDQHDGCLLDVSSIFDRFRAPEHQKIIKILLVLYTFLQNRPLEVNISFCSHSGPNLLSFSFQNPPKSFQKPRSGAINLLLDIWMEFLSILGPTWHPTWGQVEAMLATFPAQTLPRRLQDDPRCP